MTERIFRWVAVVMLGLALIAGPALADKDHGTIGRHDVTVKAGTGVRKRQPVGVADSFAKGTKVWVWTSIKDFKDAPLRMLWYRGEELVWEKAIEVKSNRYRTWFRRKLRTAGDYKVSVVTADGGILGEVSFSVK